jgi:hypothetical protein
VVFGQDVCQMVIVVVGIISGSQGSDILLELGRKTPRGRPTPVAVD